VALEDREAARSLVVSASRMIFGCSLACALPLIAAPELVLAVFGPEFVVAAPALRILTLAYLVGSYMSLANAALSMHGDQRPVVLCLLIGIAASFLLNLTLIPSFGLTGAALASAASGVAWRLALFVVARRRLGFWTCPHG
jgi:O-antigen/teichoic acid export membrane protein